MVEFEELRKLALSFEEATEEPHMEKTSFRIKKIFMTYDFDKNRAVLKFNEVDQSVFTDASNGAMYPVNGGWGKKGWTFMELANVHPDLCKDAVTTAYCTVAPKKLAAKYLRD